MSRDRFNPDAEDAAPGSNGDPMRCCARGCPNPWSSEIDAGLGRGFQRVCRAHAVVPPRLWPLVTDAQLRARVDAIPRELRRMPVDADEVERLRRRLQALRDELDAHHDASAAARAWAYRLKAREANGAFMRPILRKAWREVLGEQDTPEPASRRDPNDPNGVEHA
jgi:hypothetical protein